MVADAGAEKPKDTVEGVDSEIAEEGEYVTGYGPEGERYVAAMLDTEYLTWLRAKGMYVQTSSQLSADPLYRAHEAIERLIRWVQGGYPDLPISITREPLYAGEDFILRLVIEIRVPGGRRIIRATAKKVRRIVETSIKRAEEALKHGGGRGGTVEKGNG